MKSTDVQKRIDCMLMLFKFLNIVIFGLFYHFECFLTYQAHQINDTIKIIIFPFKLEHHVFICSPSILESSKILPFVWKLKF